MHVYIFSCSVHLFFMFPWLEEGGLTSYRTALVQNQHLAVLARVGLEESWIYLTFQVTWWIFIVVAHWNNSLQTCYSTRVHYHDSEPTSLYSYSLKCSTRVHYHDSEPTSLYSYSLKCSTRVHYHDSEPTSLYSYSLKCSTKQLLHRCGFFSNQHLAVLENVLLVIYIFFLWSHQVVYIFPLISPSGFISINKLTMLLKIM
jgi:hypothetical protein